jgi:signal transduction histidine kinase
LNHTLLFISIGGIFLAAVYHTILYLHRKENLLNYYSQYLWVLLLYLGYRVDAAFDITGFDVYNNRFNWDEIFQMLGFMFYIRFLGRALFLTKEDNKYAWYFYTSNIGIILSYCLFVFVFSQLPSVLISLKILIRLYLLIFGLISVVVVYKKKQSPYHRYLFAAAISMIFFGFLSSISMVTQYHFFGFGPFHWLLLSFYIDVIFFSAALGYLIKMQYQEKEKSLNRLHKKDAELQRLEIDKMITVYKTREEERIRIARDLHDDMGSTLSSINIYSKVVADYVGKNNEKAFEFLHKIQNNTKELMEKTSDLIWALQSNYGESESILTRIYNTGIELLSSANIISHIIIPGEDVAPTMNMLLQKNLWLIFKEAVNNVCKYSKASNCSILITMINEEINFSIWDDGIGISKATSGNGLNNMEIRAKELGGKFEIVGEPGYGTKITVQIPFS